MYVFAQGGCAQSDQRGHAARHRFLEAVHRGCRNAALVVLAMPLLGPSSAKSSCQQKKRFGERRRWISGPTASVPTHHATVFVPTHDATAGNVAYMASFFSASAVLSPAVCGVTGPARQRLLDAALSCSSLGQHLFCKTMMCAQQSTSLAGDQCD